MLARLIQEELERGIKAALRPAALYLRELSLGAFLLILAGGIGCFVVLGLAASAYLGLLTVFSPAVSALTLAGIALLVMLALLFAGLSRLRPPR